jgi:hypothetical protein
MSDESTQMTLRDGWEATLTPTQLTLTNAKSGLSHTVERAAAPADIERYWLSLKPPAIVLRKPKRQRIRVLPEQGPVLDAWCGPDYTAELPNQVQNRMLFGIPFGLACVATSAPPPVWIGLGLLLVLEDVLARKSPRKSLFLLDALFWVLVLVHFSVRAIATQNVLFLLLVVPSLALLATSVRLYQFFSRVQRVPALP